MVAAGHQHQLAQLPARAEVGGGPLTGAVLTPGTARGLGTGFHQAKPQLLQLGQQHHPEHRSTVVHQGQMHGVLARALQKVLGAIQRIEDPQPLGLEGHAGGELLLGGLLAQQGPGGRGEGRRQPIQQPLVHGQIRRTHRALTAVLHAQGRREAIGGLLAAAVGQQDVGGAPAQPAQLEQQGLLSDPGKHHGDGKGAL